MCHMHGILALYINTRVYVNGRHTCTLTCSLYTHVCSKKFYTMSMGIVLVLIFVLTYHTLLQMQLSVSLIVKENYGFPKNVPQKTTLKQYYHKICP